MAQNPSRIHWNNIPPENPQVDRSQPPNPEGSRGAPPSNSEIDRMGRDLTRMAREGLLHPMYGREKELLQLQRILLRKQKNSPLLVGAPGVGKTVLVEGLAQAIANGNVAADLRNLRIIELPIAGLMADTMWRGSLEARIQVLLAEAAANPQLVLFIDEIHTIVRAGSVGGGSLDLANMFKPALANGTLHLIGATTLDENDRFLKSDPAFERRFEPLIIEEPTESDTINILSAAVSSYEAHHHLRITPEAVQEAVRLSVRHILDRRLPDKAFDLLDSACTLVRVPDQSLPPVSAQLACVDADVIRRAVAEKCHIPVERLDENRAARLNGLEEFLSQRILGQEIALKRITGALIGAFTGLANPNQPRQVFAFFGSSGVGKTATAIALADYLFDSPQAVIRLDMNQFKEPHSVSRLLGTPPGYIGYDDENSFATTLRRQPYSVVLLDEVEKAHPQIMDMFLNIFDSGRFSDTHGRQIDGRQAIFILTSNLFELPTVVDEATYDGHVESVRGSLSSYFRPEFVNRIQEIVLFNELPIEILTGIVKKEILELNQRLVEQRIRVELSDEVAEWIARNAFDRSSGARAINRFIFREVATPVARRAVQDLSSAPRTVTLSIIQTQLSLEFA